MTDVPLCFVDIESDGVHPGRRPWEVALIRREPGGSTHVESFFVEIDLSTADLAGLKIGRFYDRHPLGIALSTASGPDRDYPVAKSTLDAALAVARYTHDAQIVGAVPNFDTECLANLLREHGLCPAWKHRIRCVETLTAGKFGVEIGGLADCATKLGIEVDPTIRHTALGDTQLAMFVYDAVMGGAA